LRIGAIEERLDGATHRPEVREDVGIPLRGIGEIAYPGGIAITAHTRAEQRPAARAGDDITVIPGGQESRIEAGIERGPRPLHVGLRAEQEGGYAFRSAADSR